MRKPAPGRLSFLRGHLAFGILAAVAIPVVVLWGLWMGLRPGPPSDPYQRATQSIAALWLAQPGPVVAASAQNLGWVAACAASVALLALPAMLLVFDKARDREPVLAGFHATYADITDYYTTLNLQRARALAAFLAAPR